MKKLLCLLFVCALCFGVFAGCSSDEKKDTASKDTPAADDGIFSLADVAFVDADNKAVYNIIRSSDCSSSVAKIATDMRKDIVAVIGAVSAAGMKNLTDDIGGTDKYEILVGDTNRPESKQARDYLIQSVGGRYQDYIIATIGKKIVIQGMNEDALKAACKDFTDNFVKAEGVKGGIKKLNSTQGQFVDSAINGVKLGNFTFVKPRFNLSYLVQYELEEAGKDLASITGFLPIITEDHLQQSEYEIIIADANREGALSITNRDEYSIKISGKKVYLAGGSPAAQAMAVSEFSKMLQKGNVTDADSVLSASYATTVAAYDKSTYYTPKWTDDFDYVDGGKNGIDTSKWIVFEKHQDGNKGQNGRTSVRTSDILSVEDGRLRAYATYDEKYYYGFKMTTTSTMTYRFGILEMSAILPHGSAFWTSLWANSNDPTSNSAYMTEINVMECFGNTKSEASNAHGWMSRRDVYESEWEPLGYPTHWSLDEKYTSQKKYECPEGNFNDTLHTFSYIWDENKCAFACDGNVYFSIDTNEDPVYKDTLNQRLYLILSEAVCYATGVGQNMADDAPEWTESNNFEIDYVHIYQMDDGKSELIEYN